jgi:hypothetical protein
MANAVTSLKSTTTLKQYEKADQIGMLADKSNSLSAILDELQAGKTPVEVDDTSGAISSLNGVVLLTKAGVAVMTLAAPTAGTDDGKILRIISTTANAHTVTQTTPGFNNAGSAKDVATFGGAVGDQFAVIAYNGIWYILSSTNVTFA